MLVIGVARSEQSLEMSIEWERQMEAWVEEGVPETPIPLGPAYTIHHIVDHAWTGFGACRVVSHHLFEWSHDTVSFIKYVA
jgi:hypothetical protein